MADNVTTPVTTITLATDDIGGVHFPRNKISHGIDGSATDTSTANPLPVSSYDTEYETIAASITDQVMGVTGAVGDMLSSLLVIPSTLSPGPVSIRDGAGGALITVFAGGASSISTLHPIYIGLGMRALLAGWRVTTGVGVTAIAVGNFT